MKNLILIMTILLPVMVFGADRPKWIDDGSKACEKKELCAVGDGPSRDAATLNANIALSKIFDSQISSKFTSTSGSENSKLSESATEEINQITQTALQGVEVKKFYEENGKFYAVASLNKAKAASTIKKEIDSLEDRMKALFSDKTSSSMTQLEGLFFKREALEKRYQFLTGADLPSSLKYEDIFKTKKDASKNIIVHVYIDEDEPKAVEQYLAKELTKLGYKVTRGQTRNTLATHIVTGEMVADKQFLSVEGFEKYSFHLKISAMDAKRVGTGEFDFAIVESGRNFSQAHDKAMPKIKEEIKDKISELKID